jgi:Enoyl-CoA hydratase/carnithine racemase
MSIQPWVKVETFEEYKERFKDYAYLERSEDGILLVRLHWKGEPVMWSYQTQHALAELWTALGHDDKNEVMILTCQDPYSVCVNNDPTSFDEVEQSKDTDLKYNCHIKNTMNLTENFINDIEIPTIAIINGIGQHYEYALMSDITLCDPDFFFSDAHFSHNIVAGDGMSFAMRPVAGIKRSTYVMYLEPKIDAKTALDWGLVHEIHPHDKLLDRAYDIAKYMMKRDRSVRRMMHEIAIRPWKRALQDDERVNVLAEMFTVQLLRSEHHFENIAGQYTEKRELFPE